MNPAEHEARADAERRQTIVGTDVDIIDDDLIAATAGEDDGGVGAWMQGCETPASLWGMEGPA